MLKKKSITNLTLLILGFSMIFSIAIQGALAESKPIRMEPVWVGMTPCKGFIKITGEPVYRYPCWRLPIYVQCELPDPPYPWPPGDWHFPKELLGYEVRWGKGYEVDGIRVWTLVGYAGEMVRKSGGGGAPHSSRCWTWQGDIPYDPDIDYFHADFVFIGLHSNTGVVLVAYL